MATTPANLYEDVKTQLQDFQKFLDKNKGDVKPAIQAIRAILPQVDDLLTKLIDLMRKIDAAIQSLDISKIPGVGQVTTFTQTVTTLLQTVLNLVPSEADAINTVLGVAKVVGSLSDLSGTIKTDIDTAIQAIIGDLNFIKNP